MIHFSLSCERDHEFEGWFRDSSDYENQLDKGFLVCPYCESKQIRKALMSPALAKTAGKGRAKNRKSIEDTDIPRDKELRKLDPKGEKILKKIREIRTKLIENSDDVGTQFAEEARKMHYGEKKKRGIYGRANFNEAKKLHEEGIDFFAMPSLPEENN